MKTRHTLPSPATLDTALGAVTSVSPLFARGVLRAAATVAALSVGTALIPSGHAHAQSPLETAISHLQYRELGPALMGGRIADLAVVESKPQIFYIGTGTGRRLEDREPRHLVDAGLRRPAHEFPSAT